MSEPRQIPVSRNSNNKETEKSTTAACPTTSEMAETNNPVQKETTADLNESKNLDAVLNEEDITSSHAASPTEQDGDSWSDSEDSWDGYTNSECSSDYEISETISCLDQNLDEEISKACQTLFPEDLETEAEDVKDKEEDQTLEAESASRLSIRSEASWASVKSVLSWATSRWSSSSSIHTLPEVYQKMKDNESITSNDNLGYPFLDLKEDTALTPKEDAVLEFEEDAVLEFEEDAVFIPEEVTVLDLEDDAPNKIEEETGVTEELNSDPFSLNVIVVFKDKPEAGGFLQRRKRKRSFLKWRAWRKINPAPENNVDGEINSASPGSTACWSVDDKQDCTCPQEPPSCSGAVHGSIPLVLEDFTETDDEAQSEAEPVEPFLTQTGSDPQVTSCEVSEDTSVAEETGSRMDKYQPSYPEPLEGCEVTEDPEPATKPRKKTSLLIHIRKVFSKKNKEEKPKGAEKTDSAENVIKQEKKKEEKKTKGPSFWARLFPSRRCQVVPFNQRAELKLETHVSFCTFSS